MRDAAIVLGVIGGADPRDATASARPVPDYTASLDRPIAGLRVGVPDRYYGDGLDGEVQTAVHAATETLRGLGVGKRWTVPFPIRPSSTTSRT